jgi:hypothetical protein
VATLNAFQLGTDLKWAIDLCQARGQSVTVLNFMPSLDEKTLQELAAKHNCTYKHDPIKREAKLVKKAA